MLRTSSLFAALALICWILADIEIITLDPWQELRKMGWGLITPDFGAIYEGGKALLNTITFAFCGVAISIVLGSGLAFLFEYRAVRWFCAFIRSIHELFWALLFLPAVGLNAYCGILAIAVPYTGIFAKVYAEIRQEANQHPLQGLPPNTSALSQFFYAVLPVIYADIKHYTSYRFECALRSSAILGFIGLPTLGFYLETAFREGLYSEAAALLYAFYFLIASLKYWVKPRFVMLYAVLSFAFVAVETVSQTVAFSWKNLVHFFTYEILPWPMRREGILNGTYAVDVPIEAVGEWAWNIIEKEGLLGIWNTFLLTQIALVGTGLFALMAFPMVCRHFQGPWVRRFSRYGLIVVRTTPEYILAYLFVQLWGPSMLPAIVAILLHNGAILGHLSGQNANLVDLRVDAPQRKTNRYFFEILPRVYGQFLAFLFYRWEVMMRESAILGILGIYTLGFYIDSAISDDKMDKAVLLLLLTAALNLTIDATSQVVRKRLKISTKLVTAE